MSHMTATSLAGVRSSTNEHTLVTPFPKMAASSAMMRVFLPAPGGP